MTIFDSIKYPVSNPLTPDEAHNIPDDIWIEYLQRLNKACDATEAADQVALLRKVILEHDDDIR